MEEAGYGSQPTIRKALDGTYDENCPKEKAKAERIRRYALNNGGVEV